MKIVHDFAVVLGTAVLTALIAAPFVGPAAARAKDGETVLTPVAAPSTLVVKGMTLSLKLEKEKYEPGARPVLVLTAVGGAKGATCDVVVRMHTTAPTSPMSRMLSMPRQVWTESVPITLKPDETRTVRLTPEKVVAAGASATFEIQVAEQRLAVAGYSLPAPLPTLELAGVGAPPQRAQRVSIQAPIVVEVVKTAGDGGGK